MGSVIRDVLVPTKAEPGCIGRGRQKFLLIFDAENEDKIRTRLDADLWAPMGLLKIRKIESWEILLQKLLNEKK